MLRVAEIGDPLEILKMYWSVAIGEPMEQVVTDAGVSIATPAQVKDRLRAGELFLDRRLGKVDQGILLGDTNGDPLAGISTETVIALVAAVRGGASGGSGAKS